MYRFRPIDKLLEYPYQELEKQEIYFAAPEELNDPMEGVKDIFFRGDNILWRNFLKHYLICLYDLVDFEIKKKNYINIDINMIDIFKWEDDILGIENKKIYREIKDKFFSNSIISDLLDLLSCRKDIRKNELMEYLDIVHKIALDSINEIMYNHEYCKRNTFYEEVVKYMADNNIIQKIIDFNEMKDRLTEKWATVITEGCRMITDNSNMINKLNDPIYEYKYNDYFINSDFVNAYMIKLEELIHYKWYTACFMSDCRNSSVWGNYGDNHKGICLKFKQNEEGVIKLIGKDEQLNLKLEKVSYQKKFTEIDFFANLGKYNMKQLREQWFENEKGDVSERIHEYNGDFHDKYWDGFSRSICTKTEDWAFEKEYRITISNWFTDYTEVKDRLFKYNFDDLEGIIFGIKTSLEDKMKIIKIINEKCKKSNRRDFKFYQASYNYLTGKIETYKVKF